MRDILPPSSRGGWPDPAQGHDDLDLPEARRPRGQDDEADGPAEPEQPPRDLGESPDVLPDVEPPDEQA